MGIVRAAIAIAAALALQSCGSGDDCSGTLSFNVDPMQCQSLAQRFGCEGFNVNGPSCGLFGCASCGSLNPMSTPTAASGG